MKRIDTVSISNYLMLQTIETIVNLAKNKKYKFPNSDEINTMILFGYDLFKYTNKFKNSNKSRIAFTKVYSELVNKMQSNIDNFISKQFQQEFPHIKIDNKSANVDYAYQLGVGLTQQAAQILYDLAYQDKIKNLRLIQKKFVNTYSVFTPDDEIVVIQDNWHGLLNYSEKIDKEAFLHYFYSVGRSCQDYLLKSVIVK